MTISIDLSSIPSYLKVVDSAGNTWIHGPHQNTVRCVRDNGVVSALYTLTSCRNRVLEGEHPLTYLTAVRAARTLWPSTIPVNGENLTCFTTVDWYENGPSVSYWVRQNTDTLSRIRHTKEGKLEAFQVSWYRGDTPFVSDSEPFTRASLQAAFNYFDSLSSKPSGLKEPAVNPVPDIHWSFKAAPDEFDLTRCWREALEAGAHEVTVNDGAKTRTWVYWPTVQSLVFRYHKFTGQRLGAEIDNSTGPWREVTAPVLAKLRAWEAGQPPVETKRVKRKDRRRCTVSGVK